MTNTENSNHSDNTVYGSYGEFQPIEMTDEEWHAYDLAVAEEIDKWADSLTDDYIDLDPEPPF